MAKRAQTLDSGRDGISELEKIQGILTKLSRKDLKSLSSWIDFTISNDGAIDRDFSLFYSTVVDYLKKHNISSPPIYVYMKTTKKSISHFDFIKSYIEESCGSVTEVQKRDLYVFFVKILAYYMDLRKIPLSIRSMMSSLSFIPGIVRLSYPGYVESGLLLRISKMPKLVLTDD